MFCSKCGSELETNQKFCRTCGTAAPVIVTVSLAPAVEAPRMATISGDHFFGSPVRSKMVALALSILLGYFGIHRFYTGKVGTGFLMLFTLGGYGVWWVIDIVSIANGSFRDIEGKELRS